ncbi:MAG: hypothetical protein HKP41_08260 [Desulfobacterales bacterium]|nr:hypothetical protein [Desulfobacterales bacterium]
MFLHFIWKVIKVFSTLSEEIQLNESFIIGKGGVKTVYQHPNYQSRCIKIAYNFSKKRPVRREILYLIFYYHYHKPFTHLSAFHGMCKTNFGKGAVFDLIRNYDGSLSKMLSDHIIDPNLPQLSPAQIVLLLDELYDHLIEHSIIACDPAANNLAVQFSEPECAKLVIVDGIGNPHFVKIADFSKKYAAKTIHKKWQKYVERSQILHEVLSKGKYKVKIL